jgi:hypothetical protein
MMWRCLALVIVAIALLSAGLTTAAQADVAAIPCEAFAKNADGSWTVLEETYIEQVKARVSQGAILKPGVVVRGYDFAAMIAKACPNARIQLPSDETPLIAPSGPPGAAPAAGTRAGIPAQPAQSLLAKYADANGNIDVRQFTCGHLDDASVPEAELLLAWYSGWYNGLAKGRGINLARVRYNIRNVIDYCKTNRDKKLTDAMASILK